MGYFGWVGVSGVVWGVFWVGGISVGESGIILGGWGVGGGEWGWMGVSKGGGCTV